MKIDPLMTVMAILLILMIIWFVLKVMGLRGSLGTDDLIIGMLMAIIVYLFSITRSIGRLDTKILNHISWHKGRDAKE